MASTTATATIYVDATKNGDGSSWEDAYKYLQDALADANASPDDIWVADGTYKPTTGSDRTASFQLINGVGIYGGFAGGESTLDERDWQTNETILSGDIGIADVNTDNSYHVVTGSGKNNTAVLDGFTITAGNANGSHPYDRGGGMYNTSGSPTLTNCTFSGNSSGEIGGGMANFSGSSPTLTNCTFSGNSAGTGGGMLNDGPCSPTLINCTFSGNTANNYDGGGMNNWNHSDPVLTNCMFSDNSSELDGGGMFNESSSPTLTNCTFSGNSAGGGGGMRNWDNSNTTIVNCVFSGNSAIYYGGGMANGDYSQPTVEGCTFSGNSAGAGGGMNNGQYSTPTLDNCILWANTAPSGSQIYNDGLSSATVSYSDVQGGWPGTGNKNADPLFLNAGSGDLRLLSDSPCIDAGDNNSVPADILDLDNDGNAVEPIPFDLDGHPRFVDGDCNDTTIVDMGAYEFNYAYIGDFDGQCDVDFVDFTYLALTWLKEDEDPGYDYLCDISIPADSVIDERDLKIFTDNWLAGK